MQKQTQSKNSSRKDSKRKLTRKHYQKDELVENIEQTITKKEERKKKEIRFCTGSDLLDVLIGGGLGIGFPAGRIINIVGDKSSGKSFLASEIIANAYHKYGKKFKWIYDDGESGYTFDSKYLYGFDIMHADTPKSSTVEELYCNYREFLESLGKNEFGIYVIDSLDGLSSSEMLDRSEERFKKWKDDKKFEKGSYQMGSAKFLSQEFFRGLAGLGQDKNALLVIISQVRDNIDPFSFKKFKRGGGKALDHYCHTVLWLANVAKIKKKDKVEKKERAVGLVVKALLDKSKTPRPYRDCLFTVLFDYGLDNTGTNIDFLYDIRGKNGLLTKGWDKLEWEDQEPMKRNKLITFIEDKKQEDTLKQKVFDKWEEIEESIKTDRVGKYGKKSV